MSGGSYDYLCFAELGERSEDLARMANRLEELGFHAQAAETRAMIREADQPLRDSWRAVEWLDSGDWSDDQALEVLRRNEP